MDEVIRVEGLTKQFGKLAVLRGIDCAIKASEVVCVIGPSGSGKTVVQNFMLAQYCIFSINNCLNIFCR